MNKKGKIFCSKNTLKKKDKIFRSKKSNFSIFANLWYDGGWIAHAVDIRESINNNKKGLQIPIYINK